MKYKASKAQSFTYDTKGFPFGRHKSIQVLFLYYLLNTKKDRTMFVSTCATKNGREI